MYKKILLATDGSEHSLRTTNHAISLATITADSYIEVVYVKESTQVKSDTLHNWNKVGVMNVQEDKVMGIEEDLQKAGISYKTTVLNGEPGPTIVDYANEKEFDIVIVGSRGLNAFQEMVLGSVSHKVAKRANCPVLIVK
ncbi:Nucleotide-binding universal stress protein, UspA family [Salinibacillus kushneri]|uniref:Nucleotide-binding universal stress protein, UspA family n=1 Tax=Salinibacillus kushneri TaxID=237682 RepID=A0A1I0ARN8_9BACI|nr:universal stress protein [Salinibacillus kushneri]SES96826.1 Nucleotide-binding universal stress protein, UspA family [Salinibacillus kushneri]